MIGGGPLHTATGKRRHCRRKLLVVSLAMAPVLLALSGLSFPVYAHEAGALDRAAVRERACMTASERTAWHMRVLQTQMMIGALQCRGRRAAGQREGYNRFVLRYRPVLKTQSAVFVAFIRRWAGSVSHPVDREVTRIANRLSLAAQAKPDFCAQIAAFGEAIIKKNPPSFGALFALMPLSLDPPVAACSTGSGAQPADE